MAVISTVRANTTFSLDSDARNGSTPTQNNEDFKVVIPSVLLRNAHGGSSLASMDKDVLEKHLQPVVQSLQYLDAEALLGLDRTDEGARLNDMINVHPIHKDVHPQYKTAGEFSCVRYIHITEVKDQYSMGIFVFPPFSRIPLHDHPGMCVLSRLLYGDLQCLSLDLPTAAEQALSESQNTSDSNNHRSVMRTSSLTHAAPLHHPSQPANLPMGARRAFKNHVSHMYAPDVSVLYPCEGNLHEFFAGPQGAAVLDILLPPYDTEHNRDCTFYDIQEDASLNSSSSSPAIHSLPRRGSAPTASSNTSLLNNEHDANAPPTLDQRTACWIIPTGQPEDFHCISGKYGKLGTNVVHMQDT